MDPMEFLVKRGLDCKSKQALILKDADGETVYCCSECPQRYNEKELMELHLCMHNKEYRFICSICGRGLKRKEHLERHMLEHQEVRPHTCDECGKAFKRKEHLNIHRNIHSTYRGQVCPYCAKTFHRKDHLQKHMQIHNKVTTTEFVEVSQEDVEFNQDEDYSQDEEIRQEYLEVSQEEPDSQEYISKYEEVSQDEEICEDDEVSQDVVVKTEPGDYEKIVTTIDVDTLLKLQSDVPTLLDTSIKSEDPTRPFACCICLKTFKRKDHLKLHNYTHMKKDKICSECGKGFHKTEQLLVHMNQHVTSDSLLESEQLHPQGSVDWGEVEDVSDNSLLQPRAGRSGGVTLPLGGVGGAVGAVGAARPHACVTCGKRFKRRQHLKVHEHTHAREAKPAASIWCSMCNEGFYTNERFEKHSCISNADAENNIDHGDKNLQAEDFQQHDMILDEQSLPVPLAVKVYVCRFCGKQFRRKDHFKIHLNIHTGIKTLFCPYCGKGFYRKDHMQKHIQVHEKKKKVKRMPELLPIDALPAAAKRAFHLPEITIHAPSHSKLRVPLKMKVPYQVVTSSENGEKRAVIVHPS